MVQRTLFDTGPPKKGGGKRPKCLRTPERVIEALKGFGIPERVARALPVRAAFARLYALREKAFAATPEGLRRAKIETAAELRAAAASAGETDGASADDLTELVLTALANLDTAQLRRVSTGLANLLEELAA